MRIRTLQSLLPSAKPAAVLVAVDRFDTDLSEFESGSVFFRNVDEIRSSHLRLVIVNPTPVILDEVTNGIADNRFSGAELWSDYNGIDDLAACVEGFDELAICRMSTGTKWVKLCVVASTTDERSAYDFANGIKVAQILKNSPPTFDKPSAIQNDDIPTTSKAVLIRSLAKIMKPVKPLLPRRVVHFLYLLLGKFR